MADLAAQVALLKAENWTLRERIAALEKQIGFKPLPPGLGLTPYEEAVFLMLMHRDACTKEQLMSGVYDHRYVGDLPNIKIIDVYICKLRKKLKGFGVAIDTHWGRGYSISPAAKRHANEMIANLAAAVPTAEAAA